MKNNQLIPGEPLREGVDLIADKKTGALIVVGNSTKLERISSGGINLTNCGFTPEMLGELAKMDGAIVVDEAAHFNLTDDSVVMNAIEPIVLTNKSDLYLVSTPRGQRGFFYDIGIGENDFKKLQYDYTCAIGRIYSKEDMEQELKS